MSEDNWFFAFGSLVIILVGLAWKFAEFSAFKLAIMVGICASSLLSFALYTLCRGEK